MKLEGMHHITMITGLRLVKKTVNFDATEAYHLYLGDEVGSPGSVLTWFEFAGAQPGRAGVGMIHTIESALAVKRRSISGLSGWLRTGTRAIAASAR